ncbi:MAG: hypothetical protein WAT70_13515 [Rhizobiaceae bacterium]
MPGSPAELDLFGAGHPAARVDIHCPDRLRLAPGMVFPDRVQVLADAIAARFPGVSVRFVAFSLGAHAALATAALLDGRVSAIELVSPAAPLESGDFLSSMAGGVVFRMARDAPALLKPAAFAQGALSALAPGLLFRMLFATAAGGDAALAAEPGFRTAINAILAAVFRAGRDAYACELEAAARGWSETVRNVGAPVRLWHGTADNWAPFAMTTALSRLLPAGAEIVALDGLSHYSALKAALAEILAP